MSVYDDIRDERESQIRKGFDAAHDFEHFHGQLSEAAAVYADVAAAQLCFNEVGSEYQHRWPFDDGFRVYDNPRTQLIKAAALLVAEIERYDLLEEADD